MTIPKVQPTTRESAAQRVYEWVRARILDGSYEGGTLVVEGEVAAAVGVSRTPVREAFLQLAAEDMLALYPQRGALVLSVTTAELYDVLVARQLVEPWACSVIAQSSDRTDVVLELRRFVDEAAEADAIGDDAVSREADWAFHQCLLDAAGNRLLASFYDGLRHRQVRSRAPMRGGPDRPPEILRQHAAIVDAIELGDSELASALATKHVQDTWNHLGPLP